MTYQNVCSKSNAITTFLFEDELPKHIKDIGEEDKIAKKTVVRSTLMRQTFGHESSSDNFKYSQRGRKPFQGLRGHRAQSSEAPNHLPHSSMKTGMNR